MITSVRVIWLVDEGKKTRDIYVLGEKKKKRKCSSDVEYSANVCRER